MAEIMTTTSLAKTPKVALTGIDASAFQHPLDRQATNQLKKIKGFDTFVAKFLELGFERVNYVLNIASNVRVGPKQFPQLYAMLREGCNILDVPEPEFYVSAVQEVNAFTFGYNRPYIVIQAGLLEVMEDDEIMAVIAHELGHVKCGHVLYTTMARWIQLISEVAGELTLGIGSWIGKGIEVGLVNWSRRAELSADRASLLVMQDAPPCISMLMKLASGTSRLANQMNLEEFLNQARIYHEEMDNSLSDRFYRFVASTMQGTHPFTVERAKHLNDWVDSREFEQILAGNYPRAAQAIQEGRCPNCGELAHPTYKFCAVCGQLLK